MNSSHICQEFCDPTNLLTFRDTLLSCLGPHGSIKAFVSPTKHLTLTTTSQRILSSLEITDPCVEAITEATKAFLNRFGDGGIRFGIWVSELTLALREFNPVRADNILNQFYEIVDESLKESKVKLDFSNTKPLLAVVKSKLGSKHWIKGESLETLSIKLLEGFLKVINCFNRIVTKPKYIKLFNYYRVCQLQTNYQN